MNNISLVKDKQFKDLPEKVLQIGEGNFLRAFADWSIEMANRKGIFNSSIVLCQPRGNSSVQKFTEQDCMYTVLLRGIEDNSTIEKADYISSVSRFISPYEDYNEFLKVAENENLQVIISNTTEKGICYDENDSVNDTPPQTYPAKLTALLYHRYKYFTGDKTKGLLILPTELIEDNGEKLNKIVLKYALLWDLEIDFIEWITDYCCFASTLVDRIVSGYPENEIEAINNKLGYTDNLLVTCEPFLFWAIEADKKWRSKFPIDKADLNIVYTDDLTPYRTRKVRILNGVHTMSVLAGYICGFDTVKEMMNDKVFKKFITTALSEEIIPTINLPENELKSYAKSVIERFSNPFINHKLLDISLYSVSKFRNRDLCSILDYIKKFDTAPTMLSFSFAALIYFYKCRNVHGIYKAKTEDRSYQINDEISVMRFMAEAHINEENVVKIVLSNEKFWGEDLTKYTELEEKVSYFYNQINSNGIYKTMEELTEI